MECKINGHRDDGRGTCAECGEFIDTSPFGNALARMANDLIDDLGRARLMRRLISCNGHELRALEAALQSIGKKGK